VPNEQQLGLLWKLAGPIARVRGWICTASSYFYRSIVCIRIVVIMKSAEQREKNRFTGYFAGKKSNTKTNDTFIVHEDRTSLATTCTEVKVSIYLLFFFIL